MILTGARKRSGASGVAARLRDGKVESVEALRFFAALFVVLYHCYYNLVVPPGMTRADLTGPFTWFVNGTIGVDIFFVISGFVMYSAAARRPIFDARAFMADRFWRIYPVLWAAVLTKIVLELVNLSLGLGRFDAEAWTPLRLLGQFLLVPMPIEYLLIPPTWTLSLEMIFYAIFSVGFLLAGFWGVTVGVLLWFALGVLWNCTLGRPEPLMSPVFQTIVLEFLYGVLIGHLYLRFAMPFGRAALALGGGTIFVVAFLIGNILQLPISREFLAGVPAAILVYGLVATNWSVPRWLLYGGRASYLLYLSHDMVLGVTAGLFSLLFGISLWMRQDLIVVPVAVSIAAAVTLNVLLENPFQQWRRRKRLRLERLAAEAATEEDEAMDRGARPNLRSPSASRNVGPH